MEIPDLAYLVMYSFISDRGMNRIVRLAVLLAVFVVAVYLNQRRKKETANH
jgi:hypothetical protein